MKNLLEIQMSFMTNKIIKRNKKLNIYIYIWLLS